jgi:hypothetical protein
MERWAGRKDPAGSGHITFLQDCDPTHQLVAGKRFPARMRFEPEPLRTFTPGEHGQDEHLTVAQYSQ